MTVVEGHNDETWALDKALPDGWYVVGPSRGSAFAYPVDPTEHRVPVRAGGVGVELNNDIYGVGGWHVSKSFVDDGQVRTVRVGEYETIDEGARAAARAVR